MLDINSVREKNKTEFTAEDIEILKKHRHDREKLCIGCHMVEYCHGCPEWKEWDKKYAEIRNAGLEKAYEKIKRYQKLIERKNELEQKLKQTEEKMSGNRAKLQASGLIKVFE